MAEPRVSDLTPENADQLLTGVQLILDGTDNFETRYLINDFAVQNGKPWIYGAAVGSYGITMPVVPGETACLRCIYPDDPPFEEHFPVVGAISSAIGSLAALEAIKLLSGCGQPLAGKMQVIDAYHGVTSQVALQRREDCSVCGRENPKSEARNPKQIQSTE